jgi:hypothetical protein
MDLLILAGNHCLPDFWGPAYIRRMKRISPQIFFARQNPNTIR